LVVITVIRIIPIIRHIIHRGTVVGVIHTTMVLTGEVIIQAIIIVIMMDIMVIMDMVIMVIHTITGHIMVHGGQ
jgi:hypothetical protein